VDQSASRQETNDFWLNPGCAVSLRRSMWPKRPSEAAGGPLLPEFLLEDLDLCPLEVDNLLLLLVDPARETQVTLPSGSVCWTVRRYRSTCMVVPDSWRRPRGPVEAGQQSVLRGADKGRKMAAKDS
jgi:hypothetical protein